MQLMKRSHPAMFDRVIGYVEEGLAEHIPWLDTIYGRCERLVKIIDGRKYFTPNWYDGKGEYTMLTPDQGLGNYCFFVLDDPQRMMWEVDARVMMRSPFSLIVWVDMRTVDEFDERNTEKVKEDVLRVLNGHAWIREGRVRVSRVYERDENVFQGFTMDEVDNQYMMSPFAAFRFEGELQINSDCV